MVLEQEAKGNGLKGKRKSSLTLPDLVVLSLLCEQPMHGYHLVCELERRDVQDWAAISRPQVYYSLNKLEQLKLIAEAKDVDGSLGPERTKFAINSKGREALELSLSKEDWATQRPPPPFQTWLALSAHLPKSTLKKLFGKRRAFLSEQLERERKTLAEFAKVTDPMAVAGELMVDLCIQMFELELNWIDNAEKRMLSR